MTEDFDIEITEKLNPYFWLATTTYLKCAKSRDSTFQIFSNPNVKIFSHSVPCFLAFCSITRSIPTHFLNF